MPLVVLLLTFAILSGLFSAIKVWKRARTQGERALLSRIGLFSAAGVLFIGALLFRLPIKYLLLALPPVFFVIVITNKVFHSARQRVRQTPPADIETMKRLN